LSDGSLGSALKQRYSRLILGLLPRALVLFLTQEFLSGPELLEQLRLVDTGIGAGRRKTHDCARP
jgi:hypothetical protein